MKWIKSKSLRFLFVVFFFVTLILPLFNMFATITTESIQNLLFTPRQRAEKKARPAEAIFQGLWP